MAKLLKKNPAWLSWALEVEPWSKCERVQDDGKKE